MSLQKYLECKLNKNVVSIIKNFEHRSKKYWKKKMNRVLNQLLDRTRGLEENIDNYQDWGYYNKVNKWSYHRCTLNRCKGHWMVDELPFTRKVIGKYGIDKGKVIKIRVTRDEKIGKFFDDVEELRSDFDRDKKN